MLCEVPQERHPLDIDSPEAVDAFGDDFIVYIYQDALDR